MSKVLDLKVFDPSQKISGALGECEVALEEKAGGVLGESVDFKIWKHQSLNKITHAGALCGGRRDTGTVCVANLTNRQGATQRLEQLLQALDERLLQALLVVTSNEVFNTPEFQARYFQSPKRLGMLVEQAGSLDQTAVIERLGSLIETSLPDLLEAHREKLEQIHPPYLKASQAIRNETSGRLDGKKIAKFFGITAREVADIVGVSRQAISKTPDSKGIQDQLRPFEEITRGMLAVDYDPALFLQWLNTPSDDLPEVDGRPLAPIDVIKRGHPQVVAAMVENSLTGHPA